MSSILFASLPQSKTQPGQKQSFKEWTQVKLPIYYESAKQNAGPFITTAGIKINSLWNEGKKGATHVVGMANEYLPGLHEKMLVISDEASLEYHIVSEIRSYLEEF